MMKSNILWKYVWNFEKINKLKLCSFADYIWETKNQGKLWKDIRHNYENKEEEEE